MFDLSSMSLVKSRQIEEHLITFNEENDYRQLECILLITKQAVIETKTAKTAVKKPEKLRIHRKNKGFF